MPNGNLGPDYQLAMRLSNIERQLLALATSPLLLNASTGQTPGQPGLSTDINGLHLFNPSGVEDITLATADGSANFNGNVNINGNLSVPNGSISNTALQNPASTGQLSAAATNFAIPTTPTTVASGTISIPAGYTQAVVTLNVSAGAVNSTASADFLYIQAVINGSAANTMPGYAGPTGGWAWAGSTKTAVLTGLSGGSISLSALAQTQTGTWGANTSNRAYCEATAIFLR
ncbi:hypothetical protein [Arthrobacter sp. efr-133-TYG-118]|uniref:hypothetical protein n=1 Tax=Arthrobacter sp. efr-133-TYG-118 TaxID=3040279 RepID=UPI00254ECC0E|nr:hypothetical protein [Arthrobacter sp. efr-133-TYG-118]